MSIHVARSVRSEKSKLRAQWLIALGYLAGSVASAIPLNGYLQRVGGTGEVPQAVYLAIGPLIALAQGHGLFIYLVTTACVLPLLLSAVAREGAARVALCVIAASIWLLVGSWMHAG